jgi:tRNA (adenine22-N1)-methyltransferase
MQTNNLRIHPRARLECALEMLDGAKVVADIGCDHGRLACALVQRGVASRCIATDVSEPSLQKAERLIRHLNLEDRVETRLGDGLEPVAEGEADALAILGMGGTLMVRILAAAKAPLNGAERCVLQPMRAAEDIRSWLYERNYPVLDDRVVREAGRYYQVFLVGRPAEEKQALPQAWPDGYFSLGYTAFQQRVPLFFELAEQMRCTTRRKLISQRSAVLERQAVDLDRILEYREEQS